MENLTPIAVIDLAIPSLYIYNVPESHDSEQTEEFIQSKGHKLSNCSWGAFDGEIQDER